MERLSGLAQTKNRANEISSCFRGLEPSWTGGPYFDEGKLEAYGELHWVTGSSFFRRERNRVRVVALAKKSAIGSAA